MSNRGLRSLLRTVKPDVNGSTDCNTQRWFKK